VPKNAGKALALWQRACDLARSDTRSYWSEGHPCPNLARALESGDPLPRDPARALAMHEDACEKKQFDGCVGAARLLRKQDAFDANRVISFYRKACDDWGAAACVELGDLFRDGHGTPRDTQAALRWYGAACSQGFVPGCRAVSRLTGAPMGDPDDPVPEPDYIQTVRWVVAEHVPALRLRLFGGDDGTVLRMRVYDEGEHRVTHEIAVPDTSGGPSAGRLPEPIDYDFDGYKDLALRHYTGANNYGDFIWIFDPARRLFVYCPELSDQPNLQLDPEHRVVTSYYHLSASEGAVSRYEWIQGKAVLVKQDTTQYILTDTVSCLEQVTRERVRGRLVETKKSCEPIERPR
jgi:hypothetical protein